MKRFLRVSDCALAAPLIDGMVIFMMKASLRQLCNVNRLRHRFMLYFVLEKLRWSEAKVLPSRFPSTTLMAYLDARSQGWAAG